MAMQTEVLLLHIECLIEAMAFLLIFDRRSNKWNWVCFCSNVLMRKINSFNESVRCIVYSRLFRSKSHFQLERNENSLCCLSKQNMHIRNNESDVLRSRHHQTQEMYSSSFTVAWTCPRYNRIMETNRAQSKPSHGKNATISIAEQTNSVYSNQRPCVGNHKNRLHFLFRKRSLNSNEFRVIGHYSASFTSAIHAKSKVNKIGGFMQLAEQILALCES